MSLRVVLGIAAILTLLGAASYLPPYAGFFVGALAVILFPGVLVTELVAPSAAGLPTLAEKLAIWFVTGTGVLVAFGFAGLLTHARLSQLNLGLTILYAALLLLVIVKKLPVPKAGASHASQRNHRWAVTAAVIVLAVGAGLLTLLSQRDSDDWFYLAHITDYVANHPLGLEDAIFNQGAPASARQWFGGAWWFVEALLTDAAGLEPVACHQIYFPILLLPFGVLAIFTLSRQVFRSLWPALLATFLQVLFYLSSVYPFRIGGWMLFCRTAQDKTLSCFLIVPVAIACAFRFINGTTDEDVGKQRGFCLLYCLALAVSLAVYPAGPVWCALSVIPFALFEWLRTRSRRSRRALVVIVLPILVCGAILALGEGITESMPIQEPPPAPASGVLSSFYFPGPEVASLSWHEPPHETSHPMVWVLTEGIRICNPLYITRYPMALAGLLLALCLIPYLKKDPAARFLFLMTAALLFFTFTPAGAGLLEGLATWKMVCPLTWILPWGLIIAFCLTRWRLRTAWAWLIAGAVMLILARGNPLNYADALSSRRERLRPTPEVVDVFRFLASQPAPQGVILAGHRTGNLIPSFLPDAYPVVFRDYGSISVSELEDILERKRLDQYTLKMIRKMRAEYIVLGKWWPLEKGLNKEPDLFPQIHENYFYRVWKVRLDRPRPPSWNRNADEAG